jgi:hypothetical protein
VINTPDYPLLDCAPCKQNRWAIMQPMYRIKGWYEAIKSLSLKQINICQDILVNRNHKI